MIRKASPAFQKIVLDQDLERAASIQFGRAPATTQPATASLSGKRRGKISLTLVPPGPESRSNVAPQRAARLLMLRSPRAAARAPAAPPSASSAKPLPSSLTVTHPHAAPDASLSFLFWGAVVVLPVIALYTITVYWLFRGKLIRR